MTWPVYFAVFVALLGSSYGASLKLPSYLKKCSRSDPKLNECALKHGLEAIPTLLKGDPYLHIPVLDPLLLKEVKIDEGTGGVRFALTLRNAHIHGVKYADVKAVTIDTVNRKVGVRLEIKGTHLQLISPYTINGQVLVLPIKGEGDMNLTLENAKGEFESDFELVKHGDGLEYAKLKGGKLDFDVGRAYFHFDNLFDGNKALGDNMNMVLNDNWQDVYVEVKEAVKTVLLKLIENILSNILDRVSYDQIFDP